MPDSEQPNPTPPPEKSSFWAELRRRKVMRVAITYAIVAWLIIQIAVATFEGFGIPVWAFRFVVIVLILGFPVALIITWAFELTPDGIKLTKNVSEEEKQETSQSKRNWMSLGFAAALPAVIFGITALVFYIKARNATAENAEILANQESEFGKSIAILPFANRSELKSDEYFTDGIHDDLLTHISRIRDIKTISRTSVMVYRGSLKSMPEIGEELKVAHILEGGVQRAGDRIRINVQLIEAKTDRHLWAEIYTRQMTAEDIFDIQTEIANTITKELRTVLSPEEQERIEKLPTNNLAALEAYFRGGESSNLGTVSGLEQAVAHFKKAVELDPDFALAHAMLGHARLRQISESSLLASEQVKAARPHIERALELDPNLSEAYRTLGHLKQYEGGVHNTKDEVIEAYEKAIELNPNNAAAYSDYANFLISRLYNAEKAAGILEKSLELDPNGADSQGRLAASLVASGQTEEALLLRESIAAKNPLNAWSHYELGKQYANNFGRFDDAIVSYRKALSLDPRKSVLFQDLAKAYASLQAQEETAFWCERVIETTSDSRTEYVFKAIMYHTLDDDAMLEEVSLARIENTPAANHALWRLLTLDIKRGQPEKSLTRFQEAYPHYFEKEAEVPRSINYTLIDIARVLMENGEREQAEYLVGEKLKHIPTMPKNLRTNLIEMLLYEVIRDEEHAMVALRRYIDAGGSLHHQELASEFESLADNPEYQAILAAENTRIAAQLKRIRKMEANGELLPIPELPEK